MATLSTQSTARSEGVLRAKLTEEGSPVDPVVWRIAAHQVLSRRTAPSTQASLSETKVTDWARKPEFGRVVVGKLGINAVVVVEEEVLGCRRL